LIDVSHPHRDNGPQELLRARLRRLIILRPMVGALLIGGVMVFQAGRLWDLFRVPLVGLTSVLSVVLAVTLLYWYLLPRVRRLRLFALTQIVGDIILVTSLVYLTGSEESVFTSVYNLSIISASILLYRKGGLASATLSSVLYGMLLNLRFFSLLPPAFGAPGKAPFVSAGDLFFSLLVNVSAFFTVAFLSSYLAEQARMSKEKLESAQSDLSRLAALHDHILQCLPSGLITCDSEGRIAFANQAACVITGLSREEISTRTLPSVFPEFPTPLLHDVSSDVDNLHLRRKTMGYTRPDGRRLELGFSLAPLRDDSGVFMGTILHFQDLTETVAMEEHLRKVDKLASIGEMAARIAHEIRNPLASVSGSIQILRKELALDGTNKKLMDIVIRETNRLNALLSEFLSFARPERLRPTKMNLSRLLKEIVALFTERAKGQWQMLPTISEGLVVEADPERIRQVVWNLLNNALEAMPDGGELRLRANWAQGSPPSGLSREVRWAVVEVEDTGPGIPGEIIHKIFDPFFTTKEKGTGLGLSIVHRLMEEMGGRVEVRSQEGVGAKFTLWIPARPPTSSNGSHGEEWS